MSKMTIPALITALAASGAAAEVLYSNFGPDDTYSLNMGMTLSYGGPLAGEVNEAAVAFTVTGGDYYLDTAEFAVLHNWGPDIVYLDIRSDLDGSPGSILESTTASGVTDPFVWSPPMVAAFSGSLILQDGQTYWLAMRTEETDALMSWAHNVTDDFGLRAWQINGGGWNTAYGTPGTDSQRGVFRVNGTLVPGPGSAVIGVVGLLGAGRRRR